MSPGISRSQAAGRVEWTSWWGRQPGGAGLFRLRMVRSIRQRCPRCPPRETPGTDVDLLQWPRIVERPGRMVPESGHERHRVGDACFRWSTCLACMSQAGSQRLNCVRTDMSRSPGHHCSRMLTFSRESWARPKPPPSGMCLTTVTIPMSSGSTSAVTFTIRFLYQLAEVKISSSGVSSR